MAHRRPKVDLRIQIVAWLTCLSAAYLLTLPIYRGLTAMDSALERLRRPPAAESYLIATRTLPVGHVVAPEDLDWGETPGFFPPHGLQDAELVLGKSVLERILVGEAVHEDRFSPHEGFGISALVPPGFRAMSLDLTSADQVSGLVEPGDHVDILVSLFDAERAASTFPVLQNVLVLAVEAGGVDMPLGTSAPRSQLTVLTTPEDANRLTHALQVGHPRLVLRPEDDDGEIRPVYVGAPVEPSRPSSAELLRAETRARARAAFLDFVRNHRFSGEERATLERALSRHRR